MGSIRLTGMNSGMDTDGMIKKIMDAERLKLKKIEDKKVTLEWKQDKWKDLNTKIYNLYTKQISALRLNKAYEVKTGNSSNESVAKVEATASAGLGEHQLTVQAVAKAHMITGRKVSGEGLTSITKDTNLYELGVTIGTTLTMSSNGKKESLDVDGDTTIQDFLDFASKAGVNAGFDEKQGRFFLSSKETGANKGFSLIEEDVDTAEGEVMEGIKALGLLEEDGAIEIKGSDAAYTLNEVSYTAESNEVTTNGLKIKLLNTSSQAVKLTIGANVDEAYNNFKGFVKEYNEVLKEMNKLYYAESARKYKPLSKEEKEAMTEKEIEQWETKIKDSLLRRDERLGSTLNAMKTALSASVTVKDQKYSLASFGVMTSSDYHEKGLLHIFGDKEDGVYGNKEDKFKKALLENPDEAGEALKEIMDGLYKKMTDGMKGTGLSSALTFYNDKEYKTLEETYKKQYNDMEEKLQKIEDKYYRQFTAMEKAMAKMNSQTNSLAGLLGGR